MPTKQLPRVPVPKPTKVITPKTKRKPKYKEPYDA
jgi:hypothetical protein